MTGETERRDQARWAQLLEAEACDELSMDERSEFDRMTAESEEHQHVRRVLAAIATPSASESGLTDEDGRLIDSVIARHAKRGRRRKAIVWLTAGVLVPIAAAAAYFPWAEKADRSAPATNSALAASVTTPQPSRREHRDLERTSRPEVSEPAVSSAAPFASAAVPPSVAELLARAQEARSARRYGAAIRAYQQLLRLYPNSAEAPLAQLSLAQLQLAHGDAAAALAGFEAYQRTGGALSQEADYGKIQALRALGRTAEERSEIERFLARYPDSLQAATLRRSLGVHGGQD